MRSRQPNTTCTPPPLIHSFNFLPLAIFIQFLNVTNVFYLINVILQYQPSISTNSPIASLVPLCFVIAVGVLKELLADIKRYTEDKKTNGIEYSRLEKDQSLKKVRSAQLKVGDILQLNDDEIVPSDCILLHTLEKHGECFVQTAQLDGERNLKLKQCLVYLQENFFELLKGEAVCQVFAEAPKKDLYSFRGLLKLTKADKLENVVSYNLDFRNFIHRVLLNTKSLGFNDKEFWQSLCLDNLHRDGFQNNEESR